MRLDEGTKYSTFLTVFHFVIVRILLVIKFFFILKLELFDSFQSSPPPGTKEKKELSLCSAVSPQLLLCCIYLTATVPNDLCRIMQNTSSSFKIRGFKLLKTLPPQTTTRLKCFLRVKSPQTSVNRSGTTLLTLPFFYQKRSLTAK